jgi:phosphoribosylcarboxyaminoimidazole (NCAIR) mutase
MRTMLPSDIGVACMNVLGGFVAGLLAVAIFSAFYVILKGS